MVLEEEMRAIAAIAAAMVVGLAATGPAGAASPPPQGADALPGVVVGVLGSGDQLALQIKADDAGRRVLRIGDSFREGWVLSALTASTATLTKDGQSRTVGLNPTGAVASNDVKRPSVVQVAGNELPPEVIEVLALTDEEVIARTPTASQMLAVQQRGLTAAESRQYRLMTMRYGLFAPSLNAPATFRRRASPDRPTCGRVARTRSRSPGRKRTPLSAEICRASSADWLKRREKSRRR